MNAADPSQDPGWGRFGPRLFLFLVPGYLTLFSRGRGWSENDGLVTLRQLWLTFVAAVVLFGVVVAFVVPGAPTSPAGPWIIALVVIGAAAVTAASAFGRHPLNCTSGPALATSYRTRFFLRLALSEAVALFGFVASFLAGHWWLYWVGAAFTFVGFALNSPTRAHLAADQERLSSSGCFQSLAQALRAPIRKD